MSIDAQDASRPAMPQVFSRILTAPPGVPWRQAQAALLEARQSAPLPASDVALRLRRLGSWTGGSARFVALYVRSADFSESFTAETVIDGQAVRHRFVHPDEQRRRSTQVAIIALASAGLLVAAAASVSMALAQRATLETQLEAAERTTASRLRTAEAMNRRWREATVLSAASQNDASIAKVLSELSWVAANRVPNARIEAFHWRDGALAVETVGPNPPFEAWDRSFTRSQKPVRPGVWAWASASPPSIKAATARPVVSELK